jgi:hypothetical protein
MNEKKRGLLSRNEIAMVAKIKYPICTEQGLGCSALLYPAYTHPSATFFSFDIRIVKKFSTG